MFTVTFTDIVRPPRPAGFLRRFDGSVPFESYAWADYKNGFGNASGEYWIGLEALHNLTTAHNYTLRVDMEDFANDTFWAEYSDFSVGPESDNYRLSISGFNAASTAGDSMAYHNGMEFSTLDRDNDLWNPSCAVSRTGGWWYKACHHSKPTGTYYFNAQIDCKGINWKAVYSSCYIFKSMYMAIIPN